MQIVLTPTRAANLGLALQKNGGYHGAWLRLKITAGAEELKLDGCVMFILTDNIPGDAPDLVVPNVPPRGGHNMHWWNWTQ